MILLTLLSVSSLVTKNVGYDIDKTKFEGVLIYDDGGQKRPGLVLVPNWLGINPANIKQAQEVAQRGYVVFVADMFSLAGRPKSPEEAGKVSGAVKGDRALMRKPCKKRSRCCTRKKACRSTTKRSAPSAFVSAAPARSSWRAAAR